MELSLHKACDTCRARKVRCKTSGADACEFCLFCEIVENDEHDVQSRNSPCSFSYIKQPRKRKLSQPESSDVLDARPLDRNNALSTLYIDSLLVDRQASRIRRGVNHPDQV
ncbi:hypothetical protein N7494_002040 [Penicillium frequentans]|uniref:Zn(2)-C6 fungal-type domain-containing protein n=1 Tax=Penicillium frequentans TaxID=3151616 RepID=A0AAD6D2W7_9EURO|nr:hypothetical protein N7494_002040 [Penicillium glabrum]